MESKLQPEKPIEQLIEVRPLEESDLPAADRIMRIAFGTFMGLPEPEATMGDADYVRTRWLADPTAAFAAEVGGELVGSNFASNWGSVGFFGPLTIRPDFWDRGVGKRLMEPVINRFDQWGVRHAGLFTFAHSTKHIGLYRKFGFWPRFLTAIMSKTVENALPRAVWSRFSEAEAGEQEKLLNACRELTSEIYEGLDLEREIRAVADQQLGETVLLWDGNSLVGLAVCHCGPGTEAGSSACYVKFGAARPGSTAGDNFDRLLDCCEALAGSRNLSRLVAGSNMARHEAYLKMLGHGFKADFQGVEMSRPNEAGYNRPGVYLIDDWR